MTCPCPDNSPSLCCRGHPFFLTAPLGSTWEQPWLVGMRACHSTTGCKTLKSLNKLDFTLSCSSCRLCTDLYLSSHHTFAWEWLASPPGSFDTEPLLYKYKHPRLHYPCALLPSGLAVPSVPAMIRCFSVAAQPRPAAMQAPEVLGEEVTQIPGSPGTHPHPKTSSGAISALLNTANLAGGRPHLPPASPILLFPSQSAIKSCTQHEQKLSGQ